MCLLFSVSQIWKLLTWIAVKKVMGNYQLKQLNFRNYFIKSVLQNRSESVCSQWRTEKFKKTLQALYWVWYEIKLEEGRKNKHSHKIMVKLFFSLKEKGNANGQCFYLSLLIQYLQETSKMWCLNGWKFWILKTVMFLSIVVI